MKTGFAFFGIIAIAVFVMLVWMASGISLLDDDWGHLMLASKGVAFALTTGWEGLAGQGGYYRPVVVLSFYFDYVIGGYEPAIYHIHNILIHTGCASLVFLLARSLCVERAVAWGSALLFFVLPIHTDSIFWIVGRTDLLCALFYLGALISFSAYLQRGSLLTLSALAACSALAFFSKEMAISLPVALAVWIAHRKAWKNVRTWRGVAVVCGALLAYFATRYLVLGSALGGTPRVSALNWMRDGAKAIAKFGMTDIWWLGIALLIASAGVFIFSSRRETRLIPSLAGLVAASLAPALGHLHNWYLYLPSAFFCVGIAAVWLDKSRPACRVIFCVLIAYYGLVLGREGMFWREASKMSERAIADLMPHAQSTTGTLFACNVPAAWTPKGAFSGKPLFAYALKNALAMRSSQPLRAQIEMVNHVWLTGDFECRVHRTSAGFDLAIAEGGFFSFHGKGQGQIPPFAIAHPWGALTVHALDSLSVALNVQPGDRIVIYDKGEWVRGQARGPVPTGDEGRAD